MMSGIKRKLNDSQSIHGSFLEEMLPENTFPLGGDVFVSCTTFRRRTMVHIRRYKKFGSKFYPTPDGVTLTPFEFMTLTEDNKLRTKTLVSNPLLDASFESREDPTTIYTPTSVGIHDEETGEEILIEFADSSITLKREIQCRSGRIYPRTVSVSDEQWNELFSVKDSVMLMIFTLKFHNIPLVDLYECITRSRLPTTTPEGMSDLIDQTLRFIMKSALCSVLGEREGLHNPYEMTDERVLEQNTLSNFNASVLNLCFYKVLEKFHTRVSEYPVNPMLIHPIIDYVTLNFMSSINVSEIIEMAREAFCCY